MPITASRVSGRVPIPVAPIDTAKEFARTLIKQDHQSQGLLRKLLTLWGRKEGHVVDLKNVVDPKGTHAFESGITGFGVPLTTNQHLVMEVKPISSLPSHERRYFRADEKRVEVRMLERSTSTISDVVVFEITRPEECWYIYSWVSE